MTVTYSYGNMREITAEARERLLARLGREPQRREVQDECRRMIVREQNPEPDA